MQYVENETPDSYKERDFLRKREVVRGKRGVTFLQNRHCPARTTGCRLAGFGLSIVAC
jgi:hypothetical protein